MASDCPICGTTAQTPEQEVGHMQAFHPEIIARRLGLTHRAAPRRGWSGSGRENRWLYDAGYHARVSVVRGWIERAQGAASDELLSYAMEAVEDLERLDAVV